MESYTDAWKNFAVFKGCTSRKDYWLFVLVNFIIMVALNLLGSVSREAILLPILYNIAVFLPSLSIGVRRMHDTRHSGWWLIVPLIGFIFAVSPGTRQNNSYLY